MRLLYSTDWHLAERPPAQRSHDYADQLFEKLAEIREAARRCNVTLMGGDFFHWPSPPHATSHRLVQRLITFLAEWPTNIYAIAGNHDQGPEGMASLDRMPLGTVQKALSEGPLHLLPDATPLKIGSSVQITGFHWTPERDRRPTPSAFLVPHRHKGVTTSIAMAHAMMMPPGGGWPFPALGFDEVASPGIDLMLVGHMHWQTEVCQWGPTIFAGPGSVARTARGAGELVREPSYAIIETDPLSVTFVPLRSARASSEVFAWKAPTEHRSEMFRGLVQVLETKLEVGNRPIDDLIAGLEQRVPPPVARLVREYLQRAETA